MSLISVTDLLLLGSQMMTAVALKIRLNLEGLLVSHTPFYMGSGFLCVLEKGSIFSGRAGNFQSFP